jgi:hypothetical protein
MQMLDMPNANVGHLPDEAEPYLMALGRMLTCSCTRTNLSEILTGMAQLIFNVIEIASALNDSEDSESER